MKIVHTAFIIPQITDKIILHTLERIFLSKQSRYYRWVYMQALYCTVLGQSNHEYQNMCLESLKTSYITNTLGFTGSKRFYMPKLAGPSNNLDRRRFRLPDESKLLFYTYLHSFNFNLYTKMTKIISFCYVFIAQPEPNPPQIFCDPEAVHLIADVKNSLKMCCMLRLLPSYYYQNVFRLFTVTLHTPFLKIKKISNYSSALLLLQLMYYIYWEDVNIKTQASGCYINHYGHR